jgi:hypothetical protein
MLPVGSINIFVGLTDIVNNFDDSVHRAMLTTPLLTQAKYKQARSTNPPLSGEGSVDDSINNTDESDPLADESDLLADDTDSTNPSPSNGSIVATSFDSSITCAPFDWCQEVHSEAQPYSESKSKGGI